MEKISQIITPSTRSVWKSGETPKPRIESKVNISDFEGVGSQYEAPKPVKIEAASSQIDTEEVDDGIRGQILDTRA